ncbi:MAG: hypothetical protein AAFU80_16620 [Pseudomonadota bacterium]
MPNVLTLYFGGTSQGYNDNLQIDYKTVDNALVEAFEGTIGAKMFIPGPAAPDPQIYQIGFGGATGYNGFPEVKGSNVKPGASARKGRGVVAGLGWHRSVWYALQGIRDYLDEKDGQRVTINIAGHSRGSITVIMMLNDIFHSVLADQANFSIAYPKKGSSTFETRSRAKNNMNFSEWYDYKLEKLWTKHMGYVHTAQEGIQNINEIVARLNDLSFNIWLFDPVGGPNGGGTSRKQSMPDHASIKRVRVLRMESGGAFLSDNLPELKSKGYTYLAGNQTKNLELYRNRERFVIPLPGSHGAGVGSNKGDTEKQKYIGMSYMVDLLYRSGTVFNNDFRQKLNDRRTMFSYYTELYDEFKNKGPGLANGGLTRHNLHADNFTYGKSLKHLKLNKKGRITATRKYDALNGHHKFMMDHERLYS